MERYARQTRRDLGEQPFYLALGFFKVAVIAEGIHARHLSGHTVGAGFGLVGAAGPRLVAAEVAALRC